MHSFLVFKLTLSSPYYLTVNGSLITTKLLDFVHRPDFYKPDDGQSPEA
jgi:hypothetical protein